MMRAMSGGVENRLLDLLAASSEAEGHRGRPNAVVLLGEREDRLQQRLRPVRSVGPDLVSDGPVPGADVGRREVGDLEPAQPRSDVADDEAVGGQRVRLDVAGAVVEPVVDRFGDGRHRLLVDVGAAADLEDQFAPAGQRQLVGLEELLPAPAGLRVPVVEDVAGLLDDGAAQELPLADAPGEVDREFHLHAPGSPMIPKKKSRR